MKPRTETTPSVPEQPEHEEARSATHDWADVAGAWKERALKAEQEAMFRQRGDYWRGEAERFRAVLEWLEQNNPAALELCPFKAPTSHAAGAGTPGVPTASGAGALTPPGSGSVTGHEEARRMAELREEAESNSKLECVGLAPGRFASWALILELLALLAKAEQERDDHADALEKTGKLLLATERDLARYHTVSADTQREP